MKIYYKLGNFAVFANTERNTSETATELKKMAARALGFLAMN